MNLRFMDESLFMYRIDISWLYVENLASVCDIMFTESQVYLKSPISHMLE